MSRLLTSLFVSILTLSGAWPQRAAAGEDHAWTNPLIPARADPHVFMHRDGYYYLTATAPEYDRIELRRARTLGGLATAEVKTVWRRPASGPMSGNIWAPEIHFIDEVWYVYFSGGDAAKDWSSIRPCVISTPSANPLDGDWTTHGRIMTRWDTFSLDATTFTHRGERYFVWTQVEPGVQGTNLMIARMTSPTTLAPEETILSRPEFGWERQVYWVNEAPAVLVKHGRVFLAYSASATDHHYCLGLLTADADADLLDPASWRKSPVPVFASSEANGQYGPGHNCFTTTPDGQTDILVYHARPYKEIAGDALANPDRATRAQVLRWRADGTPDFGEPVPDGPYRLP
ncbi:MAG: glycoside hydrolase family 43 protein [Opitutaceae bacterium]|nr:glycoside hydrolase family 43 protein [Opitutaceae bacterium]